MNPTAEQYNGFVKISPDAPVQVIPSLCMSCKENGETRLLTTKIPFFKSKYYS